jgi:hypothetical protein
MNLDRGTRVGIGQRAHGFILHSLAYWPTFRGYEPVSEETAAAELGVSVQTLQGLKEGNLESLTDLNRRVRRRIGRVSVGAGADVVDYYLPTRLPQGPAESSED